MPGLLPGTRRRVPLGSSSLPMHQQSSRVVEWRSCSSDRRGGRARMDRALGCRSYFLSALTRVLVSSLMSFGVFCSPFQRR